MDREYLKSKGIFPTPADIISYVCSDLNFKKYKKILEPGFGTGNFLEKISQNNFLSKIYGVETEHSFFKSASQKYKKNNIKLLNNNYITNFDETNFDLIIGNPPYGSKISQEEISYIKENKNIFIEESNESSILFLYKSIFQLKKTGRLIFILPSTVLRVFSYKNAREYIKKHTIINKIIHLGKSFPGVGYEMIVLDLTKKEPTNNYNIEVVNYEKKTKHLISFGFIKHRDVIPLNIDSYLESVILKIENNSIKLKDISNMPRGISITNTDKRIIKIKKKNYTRMIVGRNIGKYNINNKLTYYISNDLIKSKKIKKNNHVKIIVQNLAYKIVATMCPSSFVTNDTINNVEITDDSFLYEYVLAVLNSKLMIFYLQNMVTNKARLNIHMDKYYLGEIPIKKIPMIEQEKIRDMVNSIMNDRDIGNREKLENTILKIYKINKDFNISQYSILGKENI